MEEVSLGRPRIHFGDDRFMSLLFCKDKGQKSSIISIEGGSVEQCDTVGFLSCCKENN